MSSDKEKKLLAETKEQLVQRIIKLEKQLERAGEQVDEAYKIAQEVGRRNLAHEHENKEVKKRIKELEDPHGRHGRGLGWVGKIVNVLRQRGRPMRAQEIIHELRAMDNEGLLQLVDDPENHLSSFLSKAKRIGRVKLFKVAGTRGGYYAVEDWVDEDGNLIKEMKVHLL